MRTVDLHRISEARSLAYHRAIAELLLTDPAILERARERVRRWVASRPEAYYVGWWAEVLERPVPEIVEFITDDGEVATELRQSTPFAGVLSPRHRWRIWREVGERARARA